MSSGEHPSPSEEPGEVVPAPSTPGQVMATQFAAMFRESGPTSLIDRVTDSQIDKMLDQANQSAIREDAYKKSVLRSLTAVAFGVLFLLFGLCYLFLRYEAKDSMEQIVALIVGLFGGGVGGFGAGRLSSRHPDE